MALFSPGLVMGSLADEFGGMLQKEFGGRRAFEEEAEGAVGSRGADESRDISVRYLRLYVGCV